MTGHNLSAILPEERFSALHPLVFVENQVSGFAQF
jgi:hypothetical protein